MDSDDRQIGKLLNRREVLALMGVAGASMLAGRPSARPLAAAAGWPSCIVRPEQTEGPYFVDTDLVRSDIRSDPTDGSVMPGVPLTVALFVSRIGSGTCTPLPGATVHLWQCDAQGVYSGVRDPRFFDTMGRKFLRGEQVTDADGVARFTTIYPGWYPGRTVHLHFKVLTPAADGSMWDFTSQLYFPDELTDRVHEAAVYAKEGTRRRNEGDGIFRQGGDQLMLEPTAAGDGWASEFRLGLEI